MENNGSFTAANIETTDRAEFNGGLQIKNSKIHDIEITSTLSTFMDTKIQGKIQIKKINSGWSFCGFISHKPSVQTKKILKWRRERDSNPR